MAEVVSWELSCCYIRNVCLRFFVSLLLLKKKKSFLFLLIKFRFISGYISTRTSYIVVIYSSFSSRLLLAFFVLLFGRNLIESKEKSALLTKAWYIRRRTIVTWECSTIKQTTLNDNGKRSEKCVAQSDNFSLLFSVFFLISCCASMAHTHTAVSKTDIKHKRKIQSQKLRL